MQELLRCCGKKAITLRPPRLLDEPASRVSLPESISETCTSEGSTRPERMDRSPCAHESDSDSESDDSQEEQDVRGLQVERASPVEAQILALGAQLRAKEDELRVHEAELRTKNEQLRLKDALLRPVQLKPFGIPVEIMSGSCDRKLPIDDDLRDLQECLHILATLKPDDVWRRLEGAGYSAGGNVERDTEVEVMNDLSGECPRPRRLAAGDRCRARTFTFNNASNAEIHFQRSNQFVDECDFGNLSATRRLPPEVKQEMLGVAKELVPVLHAAAASAQSAVEALTQEVQQPDVRRLPFQTP